jgi:hypothetical protein
MVTITVGAPGVEWFGIKQMAYDVREAQLVSRK